VVPAAVGAGEHTDFAIFHNGSGRRPMGVSPFTFMVATNDQDGPAGRLEQRAKAFDQARYFAKTQNQHLPGSLAELPRELMRHVTESKLGPHLQAMNRLGFGTCVQQSTHSVGALGRGRYFGHDADVDGLG
jgi:hypothetical protein